MTSILYIDGGGPVSVEYVDLFSGVALAGGDTITGVPFGDAAEGRKIVIAVHAFGGNGSDPNLTAATIGGVTASISVGDALTPDLNGDPGVWFIAAEVPSGTSGDVELTFSDDVGVRLGIWRMVNAESLTPTGTPDVEVFPATTSSQTVNTDVVDKGVQFAACSNQHDGGTEAFTAGITSPDYVASVGSGTANVIGGFELITADQSARAVTAAVSGGATSWRGVLATVSFR